MSSSRAERWWSSSIDFSLKSSSESEHSSTNTNYNMIKKLKQFNRNKMKKQLWFYRWNEKYIFCLKKLFPILCFFRIVSYQLCISISFHDSTMFNSQSEHGQYQPVSMVSRRVGWRMSARGLASVNGSTCSRKHAQIWWHLSWVLNFAHHSLNLRSQSSPFCPETSRNAQTFHCH